MKSVHNFNLEIKECLKHSFSISGTLCTIYTGILYTELAPIAKYGS